MAFATNFIFFVSVFQNNLFRALAIAAIVGLIMVVMTREDAFPAGDRQPKMIWAAILGGSAFAMILPLPILSWVGAVATGVYWFDVRPQLRSIINGEYNY
ncbi:MULTISPECIES: DUF2516 family protein [Corynebacterium]|jgi:hypothetical protein|uniref:DUF2516 family protein n=1 Tax=Corynebacterium stationis TaxID=1705 RepID=A0A0X8VDE2_9CORY|nr:MULTISPECIES: DUF2516 family protein [Corynebacterium]AMJ43816.1 hypothetical protein AW169_02005 [Corynebacterium stationis]AQX70268.1 hypothetical protein CA21670_01140 [Corynebacterium stationis]ASJ17966.1 hypothetical protein BA700_02005 [Corynebacterium stationis]MDN6137780.1 DUF2516 family protein [Corynebacterium sp.]MDN6738102.1 DUF2516 family protein [Corynebacterium sp.]